MNEDSIETLREIKRNSLLLNRRKNRDEGADNRRCSMTNIRVTPDLVLTITNKLKTKSFISLSELQTLKNALIEDGANTEMVLNTHGAIRGLVREMTGNDVSKQCAAIGCFCNLALGDSRACVVLVKAAGPYLIACHDSLTVELAVTSAWTVGNLAGSGVKSCELLTSQGAIAKLIEFLASSNEEMRDAALYAVTRYAHQMKDDMRTEYLEKTFQFLHHFDVNTSQFMFIMSCHKYFSSELLSHELLSKLLQHLVVNLDKYTDENLTYIFRFLANVDSREVFVIVLTFFLENNLLLDIKKFSKSNEAVLWFLGNAFKLCKDHSAFEVLCKLQ